MRTINEIEDYIIHSRNGSDCKECNEGEMRFYFNNYGYGFYEVTKQEFIEYLNRMANMDKNYIATFNAWIDMINVTKGMMHPSTFVLKHGHKCWRYTWILVYKDNGKEISIGNGV